MEIAKKEITTQAGIRFLFWASHLELKRLGHTKQNSYPADVRMAFCDFVEHLHRDGHISDGLAQRATL